MKKYIAIFVILLLICVGWYFAAKTPPLPHMAIGTNADQPSNTVEYVCNGDKTIVADFYDGTSTPSTSPDQPPVPGGTVNVQLSDGRAMTLSQTVSADGARYANPDGSFVFWSKGNGALVLENNQQQSYIGCIRVTPPSSDEDTSVVYMNSPMGFTLRMPSLIAASSSDEASADQYTLDESFTDQVNPQKNISGVKFTIPASGAQGTNLGSDSYIAVESIPQTQSCTAGLFLDNPSSVKEVTDNGTTYSFASSSDAGAGNRYDTSVYAIPGTNPCTAVKYFIHYSAIENYPAGAVKEFDEQALTSEFDQIRRTLVLNQ